MHHMRLRPVRRLPIAFGWLTKRGDAATRRWIQPVLHQRAIRRDTVRALRAAAAENVMLEAAGSLGAYHRPALVVGRTRTASCRPTTPAASPSSSPKAGWSRYRTPTRSSPGPAPTALADRAGLHTVIDQRPVNTGVGMTSAAGDPRPREVSQNVRPPERFGRHLCAVPGAATPASAEHATGRPAPRACAPESAICL